MTQRAQQMQTLTRKPACDLCGGDRFELVSETDRRGDFLTSVVCRKCGLVSHGKIPTDDELAVYYGQDYRRDYHGETTPSAHRVIRAWKNGQRLVRLLQAHLQPGDRVFEVGAGIGCTVKAFELAGHDATGIEPNEGFSAFSRDRLKSTIRIGALDDVPQRDAYDLVLLIHVIEHFNRPGEALRKIRRLLKPGGTLYVECPNVGAPHAAPGKIFHFAHIYNFTPQTLAMLARACGFEVKLWLSGQRDKELKLLLTRTDREQLEIDPHSYSATVAALNRFNGFTYHFRPSYVIDRLRRLAIHWSEHVLKRSRLNRILARCQPSTPVQAAGKSPADVHRRAA